MINLKSVLSISQMAYNTVIVYTIEVDEMLEDISLPEDRFGYLKSPKTHKRAEEASQL